MRGLIDCVRWARSGTYPLPPPTPFKLPQYSWPPPMQQTVQALNPFSNSLHAFHCHSQYFPYMEEGLAGDVCGAHLRVGRGCLWCPPLGRQGMFEVPTSR